MSTYPFISVIIPVKPGGEVRSLSALKGIDYPRDRMEVIVAEGRQPSVQRNIAARKAKGEILFFLDDDSMAPPGLFKEAVKRYSDPKVSAVGGPIITPPSDSFLQKGFGLTLSSIFGGSSIRARYKRLGAERPATENELILANLSFRREVFLGAGGFNEKLYPNEENELMNRLNDEGHVFMYVPDAYLLRGQRKSYRLFMKQVFTYGRGRMDQNYAHPEGFRPLHLAPPLFLAYCLGLPFVKSGVYFWPGILYIVLSIMFSALSAVEGRNPLYIFVMPVLFLTLHLGYGAGFLWGALKGMRKKKPSPPGATEVFLRAVDL